jgi:26S proteasome regulatory subunit N13
MIPTDGTFTPYEPTSSQTPSNPKKPTNGRIYVLKFTSSSQRHLFWLQSRSQHESSDPAWFSARDLKLGQIVNTLLQGEDIDVQQAIADLPSDQNGPDGDDDDDDATMEDVEGHNHDPDHHTGGSGGAGPDATGGDVREEGQEAREGGADGGRA